MRKISPTPPEEWPPQARDLYDQFADRLTQRMHRARSYLFYLHHFFRHQLAQGLTFREFPLKVVYAYADSLPLSCRRQLTHSNKARLRFLFARKELLWPIHEELVISPYVPRRRVPLSHEQVLTLLSLPPLDQPKGLRDRAVLEVAYATGMRRGELGALDLGDIDLAAGTATIRQSKNTYQRSVPLTRWALHFLQRYLEQARPQLTSPLSSNALWLGYRGGRFNIDQIVLRLRRLYRVEEALGVRVTLHLLRHSMATHLLTGGADLRSIQEYLGHQELENTKTYTHITPAYLRQVHRRCHPRNLPGDFDF